MVIDTLSNIAKYTSLNPHFAKAFYFLAKTDLKTIAAGKYPIDGENVFATIVEGTLKKREDAKLEAHDKYIDIQVVITGKETFGWLKREACVTSPEGYNAEKDLIFFTDQESTFVTLTDGEFAIFFPEDGHTPMIGEGAIKKCIIKIKA